MDKKQSLLSKRKQRSRQKFKKRKWLVINPGLESIRESENTATIYDCDNNTGDTTTYFIRYIFSYRGDLLSPCVRPSLDWPGSTPSEDVSPQFSQICKNDKLKELQENTKYTV